MLIPLIVSILIAAAMSGFAAWMYQKSKIPWIPVPGTTSKYVAFPGWKMAPEKLGVCILKAAEIIQAETKTSDADMKKLLGWFGVIVHPGEAWTDSYDRKIGGDAVGYCCEVNESVDALAHEMAHVWEFMEHGGVTDGTHASWPTNGLAAADQKYRAWLGTQS